MADYENHPIGELPELDWSEGVPGTGIQRHRASTPHREVGLNGVVLKGIVSRDELFLKVFKINQFFLYVRQYLLKFFAALFWKNLKKNVGLLL
jgi:hypothetical protein